MSKLLLFDIDCTLLNTTGAGIGAFLDTASEIFGQECARPNFAGYTDAGIVGEIIKSFESDISHEEFYTVYLEKLEKKLYTSTEGSVLPGVEPLLKELNEKQVCLGLLTGNIYRGARKKMSHFGLDVYFPMRVGAYGDEHHNRDMLGPIALKRAKEFYQKDFQGKQVCVIGDTPKDISCGKAIGAFTLAVATGSYSKHELEECGADLCVDSMESPLAHEVLMA